MNRSPFIEEIHKILNLVKIPVIIYDSYNDINTFVNNCFIEEIGYTKEDIPNIKEWFMRAYPDEDYRDKIVKRWKELMGEANERGTSFATQPVKICNKSGVYKWYEINRNVVDDMDVVTYNNVDKLYKQNEQLAKYNDQINMLLSIISHDVRTPLGLLKNMVDNYASLDLTREETESLFSSISQEINQTFQLINTALLWVSSNNEIFSFHEEEINLCHFFSGIKENYLAACKEKNITINVYGDGNTSVNYDIFILEVVCRNILNNDIKYCFENCKITITWEQSPGFVDIHIKDDGPGMSEQKIASILMNKKDPDKKNGEKKGFGIGLKLINQCLKKYHGELMIESEINKGSRFTVRLPYKF